ncbi:MAG TPA: hypothetical protein VHP37_08945 [Burkholderiales bacterium]|nr:hypothetical protein [Burkholderiales bacterium]
MALLIGVVDEFSEGVGNRGKYRFFLTLEDQRRIFCTGQRASGDEPANLKNGQRLRVEGYWLGAPEARMFGVRSIRIDE